MKRAEAELIYEEIKSTDDLIKEMESLRPSNNPFVTVFGYALAFGVLSRVLTATDFGNSSQGIAMLLAGVVVGNQIVFTEINRRTHKRIDTLYKLVAKRTAKHDA